MNARSISVCLALSIGLSACGGGGSSTTPETAATPAATDGFPVAGAMATIAQSSFTYTLSTLDTDGVTITGTFTQTVGMPTSFEGQAVTANSQVSVFKKQNTLIGQINQVDYVQASPYLNVGQADQDTHEYTVINTTAPLYLPASAKVGSSGSLNSATVYADSTKATVLKQTTRTWSLEAGDTASTALLCFNNVTVDLVTRSKSAEYDCYRINTSGVLLGMQIKLIEATGLVTIFK